MYEILYRELDGKVRGWCPVRPEDPVIFKAGGGYNVIRVQRDCAGLDIKAATVRADLLFLDPDYKPPLTAEERHQETQTKIDACYDTEALAVAESLLLAAILDYLGFSWPRPISQPERKEGG